MTLAWIRMLGGVRNAERVRRLLVLDLVPATVAFIFGILTRRNPINPIAAPVTGAVVLDAETGDSPGVHSLVRKNPVVVIVDSVISVPGATVFERSHVVFLDRLSVSLGVRRPVLPG